MVPQVLLEESRKSYRGIMQIVIYRRGGSAKFSKIVYPNKIKPIKVIKSKQYGPIGVHTILYSTKDISILTI